jgi:phosphoribosylamine--glycine ligase
LRILVIGGGGREHAIIWKLAQSPRVERIYCAPGNAGIAKIAECINLKPTDLEGLANFADDQRVGLTVVGPEAPLIAGIVDRFEARGLPIFGPATDPARIEGSKTFAKELMVRYGIPTAEHWPVDNPESAHARVRDYFAQFGSDSRLVVKADGIAAGKGVVVARGEDEAHAAVDDMMVRHAFGAAGEKVVLEECLEGEEASIMAFTDGENVLVMPPSQDHKRIFDNDAGPNTGGMGAYSPVPVIPQTTVQEVVDRIIKPAIHAIRDLGIPYKGVLYAGIMATADGPKTIEFNCRFGDPETQAILPLLKTDLLTIMDACVNCSIENLEVEWRQEASVAIVAASGGYPGEYATGKLIEGLDRAAHSERCLVFHAGTREENGQIFTDGGRILAVTGLGHDLAEAAAHAYDGIRQIEFDGIHYRKDIAGRALT